MSERCKDCRFVDSTFEGGYRCRRHAPVARVIGLCCKNLPECAGCVIWHRLSSKSVLDGDLFKFHSMQLSMAWRLAA